MSWLPADLPEDQRNDGRNRAGECHGTAMLSLVGGKTLGIAKAVNPVIVRLPGLIPTGRIVDGLPESHYFSPQDWINRLGMIDTDLGPEQDEQQEARAVVLLAHYYPRSIFTDDPSGFVNTMHGLLTSIIKKGAVVVTGSGNIPRDGAAPIDGWPANFGKTQQHEPQSIPELIVAGAISANGDHTPYKSDPESGVPHVYAPVTYQRWLFDFIRADSRTGIQNRIITADGEPNRGNEYKISSGTSDGKFAWIQKSTESR